MELVFSPHYHSYVGVDGFLNDMSYSLFQKSDRNNALLLPVQWWPPQIQSEVSLSCETG